MPEYLAFINTQIVQLGWVVIVPLLFLENIPIIGFIAPGITVLFLAGFLSSSIIGGPILLFVVCVLTIIVADTIWYILGRVSRGKWRSVSKIAKKSPNVEELLAKQPFTYLIFYQFIPYFRMFLPFALGMYLVSFRFWLTLVTLGSTLFVAIFFGVGLVTAKFVASMTRAEEVTQTLNIVIVGFVTIYTLYLIIRYLRIRKKRINSENE